MIKRKPIEWDKWFINYTFEMVRLFKYIENFKNSIAKIQTTN